MAEWRLLRGWSAPELSSRLAACRSLSRNFDDSEAGMTPERGWSRHYSTATIAREPAGPPVPGGAFATAWQLLGRYAFSDPRIVRAHFDAAAPLQGRVMLIEILIWGLHYLNPVVVSAIHEFVDQEKSVKGFRYETLDGHVERGLEWFLLTKQHASGEVSFTVHAGWRGGQLPNWWSRVGFRLLATRYQRAWHRLAHVRMRGLLGSKGLERVPRGRHLVHSGPPLPVFTVQEVASGAPPSPVQAEHERTPTNPAEAKRNDDAAAKEELKETT